MPTESLPSRIHQLRSQALRLDRLGAHQRAEPLLSQVVALVETSLRKENFDLVQALNDRASCRFNGGRLKQSLEDYQRLLQLLNPQVDPTLVAIAQEQMNRCLDGMRLRVATAALREPMASMIRGARTNRAVDESPDERRLRMLARRLIARGRLDLGARLMQRWLDVVSLREISFDPDTLEDLRTHAHALRDMQRPHAAGRFLRSIIGAQLRQRSVDSSALIRALRDWASCLSAIGQHQSAQETLALANSMAAKR